MITARNAGFARASQGSVALGALAAVLCSCLAASVATDAIADGAKVGLSVSASSFKNTKGQAIVAVYNSKETWLKLDKAVSLQKVAIGGATLTIKIADLPPGTYGVSVIHDENSNGKLDFRILPPGPAEGAGVSNDATALIGPPSWADSKFSLGDKGGSIKITMRY